MKKQLSLPLTLLFVALFLSSCEEENGVEVKGITGISVTGIHKGVVSLYVKLLISNGMKHQVVVRGLKATVLYGETAGGEIRVTEKIRIRPRSEKSYEIPVEISLHDLGNLGIAFLRSAVNQEKKELHLQGVLKIRSGILCKRIPFDEKQKISAF
jgi:LEA14-like dessication related protein